MRSLAQMRSTLEESPAGNCFLYPSKEKAKEVCPT